MLWTFSATANTNNNNHNQKFNKEIERERKKTTYKPEELQELWKRTVAAAAAAFVLEDDSTV